MKPNPLLRGLLLIALLCDLAWGQRLRAATARLEGSGQVRGSVTATQRGNGPVIVSGRITGLSPGHHGFHVHQDPVQGADCASAGPHFNPFNSPHGGQRDRTRHVGDLGNIVANEFGVAEFQILDYLISLEGKTGIRGRAFVVHLNPDDLGRGGNEESTRTGNAGGRLACGTISEGRIVFRTSDHDGQNQGPEFGGHRRRRPFYGDYRPSVFTRIIRE